ncbi:phage tail tape measure protein [Clostridium nigeriense]|uniref:phage tail tape measure protein n=1 Tax=Clostridium nigeriense TaxID=1805470 RepID=UPI003D33EF40
MSGASIKIGASSSEFQKQMKEVTQQLKLVSSECGLATEKAKAFGTTQEKLSSVQKELTAKIQAQTQIIQIYKDRITGINNEIDKQKSKQSELTSKIEDANKKYKESVEQTGKNSEESKKLKSELQALQEEYARNEKAIQNNNNKLVDTTSKMNNTEKAIIQNKKALEDINKEINNSKIDKLSENFKKVGDSATDVGKKMSVVSTGIVATGTALGKMAFDTENDLSTLSGRLGLTSEETEKLKDVAKSLYNNGFGESLEDCVNDVVLLQQNIKETSNLTNEQKENLLEQISTIKTLFGAETDEITKTLNNMLKNGIIDDLDQGLDLITKGFQNGLNSGGDLLDVLYEYSPQFKKLGLDGQDALSYIKAGLDAGGYNADKMADSLKELSIRAIDGSNTTIEGFELIGLNADEMARKFAAGGDTAKEALNQTIEGLKNIQDPIEQDLAGVNLFGTMWEDSSKDAILAMNNINGGLTDITGATEKAGEEVNNSFGKQFSSILREAKSELLPFGQELLNLAKVALPELKNVLKTVTNFLSGLSDEGRKNILTISGIVAAIGPTLIVLGSFSKGISNIINGYKDMKEFGGKAIDVIKNISSNSLNGVKAVGNFATTIGKNMVTSAVNGAKAVGNLALNLGKATLEFAKSAVQASISAAKFIAHKVATVASTIATNAMAIAQAALNFVMNLNPITLIIIAIASLVAAIVILWNKCEWFRNLCLELFEALKVAWNTTINFFKSIWEGFVAAFKLIWDMAIEYFKLQIEAWKTAFEIIVNAIRFIWESACNIIKNIWNIVINTFRSTWEGWKSIFQSVSNTIQFVWQNITNTISLVWSGVVNGIKNAWNGIISPFQRVVSSITSIWSNITSMFKLPHFSITGKFSLSPPSIPRVSVDWYYNGGIFKTPTILNGIGVGDAFNGQGSNAEAVVPLNEMYRNIKGIVDSSSDKDIVIYITNVTELDGEVISEKTSKKVIKKISKGTNNYRKSKGGLALG